MNSIAPVATPLDRNYRAQWIGLIAALAVLFAAVGFKLYLEYQETLAHESLRLSSQARVIADNLEVQLLATSEVMKRLRDRHTLNGSSPRAAESIDEKSSRDLNTLVAGMSGIRVLSLLDASGRTIASNRAERLGRDFSSRAYFQTARAHPDAAVLYISAPFITLQDDYGLNVTRTLNNVDGRFAGVVTATLDPDYFRTLMRSVLYEPGMEDSIAHGDGLLFILEPDRPELSGIDLAVPGSLFSQLMAGDRSDSIGMGEVDATGKIRMIAQHRLQSATLNMDKPLVVSINRELGSILASWRRMAWAQITFCGLFMLASVLGLHRHQRRLRELDLRAQQGAKQLALVAERLELATRASGIAVWDYDLATGKLVWDPAMFTLYGMPPRQGPIDYSEWLPMIHGDDLSAAEQAVRDSLQSGEPLTHRFRIHRRDGQTRLIEAHGRVFRSPNGASARMVGSNEDITEREATESALRRSQQQLQEAQRIVGMGNWWLDVASAKLNWSPQLYHLVGLDPSQPPPLLEEHARLLTPPSWQQLQDVAARARADGSPYEIELEAIKPDGTIRFMLARGEAVRDALGRVTALHGVVLDITERRQAESRLQLSANVFSHAHEGILITDAQQRIIEVNEAFTRITGYSREEVLGQTPRLLSSGRQSPEFYAQMWAELKNSGRWIGEIWNRRKDGMVYAELLALSSVTNSQGRVQQYVALFSDITAIKHHQSDLEHIAHFDALTGLPNRVLLADRLHQAMAHALRRHQRIAVAFLDLDGFKAINDSHGHGVGDELLIAVAQHMKAALREGDTLARLGGDEFVAVLLDLPEPGPGTGFGGEELHPLMSRLISRAAQPIKIGDHVLRITVSAGVSCYPQTEDVDGDQLLRQADLAMYQAKLAGKNRYSLFDAEHDRSMRSFNEGLAGVRDALKRQEFVLHYQPKVNMRNGQLHGVEALIRWNHPQRGLLAPGQFLPEIENHGVIAEIGEWVIAAALAQMAAWRREGLVTQVSVNIAGHHLLQPGFVERLQTLLAAEPDVRPHQLELEVLESSALGDLAHVSHVIAACGEMGVGFAIDDFGTGYSSLTYLKRLDAQLIKVDQSFVREMLDDPENLAILEGVLGLARAFRRDVIAEGVETVEHGEALLRLGCELGQGYGIARPMSAEQLPGWVARWRPDGRWAVASQLDPEGRAQLYALVEHRAWITAVVAALTGRRDSMPSLDIHQCRFGQWLDVQAASPAAASPALDDLDRQHREVHALAEELHALQLDGQETAMLARLPMLYERRDSLLSLLSALPLLGAHA